MIGVIHRIAEIFMHHNDDIGAVRGIDDAAVVAAGVHTAAFGSDLNGSFFAVVFAIHIVNWKITDNHGVVVLLFKDFNHSGIFLWSDKLVLCQADKDAGIILSLIHI